MTRARATPVPGARSSRRYWSARVTRESDALDLEHAVFTQRSPRAIAQSLKRSAEASRRRKGTPFQSAMSMLTFYVNRAGSNLSAGRKRILNRAKDELRDLFGRGAGGARSRSRRRPRAGTRSRGRARRGDS